ncbi:MAG: hypothetical protein B6226_02420 [Candidatus Cloacimonetes bacterium 4572_65]|nr:MAG: hypothetical protein B6226_02420 [Candidatus Cloacimonetes bacterium 4572_65]
MSNWSIAIHGGAGTIKKGISEAKKQKYVNALDDAVKCGIAILKNGGSAADAVTASVVSMEDNLLLNAGKGAVYNSNEEHELDASFMCGKSLQSACFGGVTDVKNPILLAKYIAYNSKHIAFSGEAASKIAHDNGFEIVGQDYFHTEHRYKAFLEAKKKGEVALDHSSEEIYTANKYPQGTVGAVALDVNGNLASATSTGGMTLKQAGRVGDTGFIGAGTYANNISCAVSCTGKGEAFITNQTAFAIHFYMTECLFSLEEASNRVIFSKMKKDDGGVIAVDKDGNISMPYNSAGMFRASASNKQDTFIGIWEEKEK